MGNDIQQWAQNTTRVAQGSTTVQPQPAYYGQWARHGHSQMSNGQPSPTIALDPPSQSSGAIPVYANSTSEHIDQLFAYIPYKLKYFRQSCLEFRRYLF
jgi:hypothetical protein